MRKLLFAAFCLISTAGINAQTYTAGHITVVVIDSMYHDSTSCRSFCPVTYHFTIDSSYTGETINIVDTAAASLVSSYVNTSGASPWIFTVPAYFSYDDMDNYLPGGYAYWTYPYYKVICGTDTLRYIRTVDSLLVTNPCIYDTVSGRVYIDNNSNCIYDGGDNLIDYNISESETTSSPSPYGAFSQQAGGSFPLGHYTLNVQQSWMVNYTVSLPPEYAFIFPFSLCYAGPSVYTTLPMAGVDFPLQCTSNVDVQCYAMSPGSVRLHTPFYMLPYVSNTGCDAVSGQLTLVKDHRVIYNASLSSLPAAIVSGDTLTWSYSSLSNLSGGAYWNSFFANIYLTPDSAVAIGDTLCFRVYTNIPAADINPANNDFSICLPVVYSYDPNEKEVSPTGTGPQGFIPAGNDTLTYTLHFQNTGTAAAVNVSITDTLDSHITASSLRILGSSHNMTPAWLAPGVVQFNYNNINLPDSGSNEAASHGDVLFSVALNTGVPVGTQIKNTGYIYFDANPAVVTNTVLNTIAKPTKIDPVITNMEVKVYPNPATDYITVENLNGGEISILNLNGAVIIRQEITNNKTTVDVSGLPGGVYILRTVSSTNTTTNKFTKY